MADCPGSSRKLGSCPCQFIFGDDVRYVQEKSKLYVLDADAQGCKLDILRQKRLATKP
jgi:hypothetical protein